MDEKRTFLQLGEWPPTPLKLPIKLTRALIESSSQMRDSLYAVVLFLILNVIHDLRIKMLINNARKSRHSDCNAMLSRHAARYNESCIPGSYELLTGLGATRPVQDGISQFPNIICVPTAFAVKAHNE